MQSKPLSDLKPLSSTKNHSFCRMCKAKIFWVVTEKGKNMPVEYDEKLEYLFDGISKPYFDGKTMISHFSSCKYAKHFRKT